MKSTLLAISLAAVGLNAQAGGFTLALPIVIALAAYGLLQLGLTRLLRRGATD